MAKSRSGEERLAGGRGPVGRGVGSEIWDPIKFVLLCIDGRCAIVNGLTFRSGSTCAEIVACLGRSRPDLDFPELGSV